MSTARLEVVAADANQDIPMQPASMDIWDKKYRLKTKQGVPLDVDIDATYRDGAIHPNTPLNLPNNTPVHVHVVIKSDGLPPTEEVVLRPPAPRTSVEELRTRLAKYAVSVQPLPSDFSRADIDGDHD